MAGPRKGERREQEILDATEELLRSEPFAALTMDDIAKAAGVSRSALYFYFASKEQVLTALHQRTYEEMATTMDPLAVPGVPVGIAMREAIDRVCTNWRAHRHLLRTFHEMAMTSPAFEAEWRQRLDLHVAALTSVIQRERAAGRAAPSPPSAATIASAWFWMLENQFYVLFRRSHSRAEERNLVDTLNILWLRMTGADEGDTSRGTRR
jgi:AcrR family transcriptional regulator